MLQAKLNAAQRIYLNFFRAGAAILVMCSHAIILFFPKSPLAQAHVGAGGVLIFFLLSGFLISTSVLNKKDHATYRFRDFFSDRFCRIYSAYLPALMFVALVDAVSITMLDYRDLGALADTHADVATMRANFTLASWIGNLLMLQRSPVIKMVEVAHITDGSLVEPFGSAGPFWTISIEWWIYMAFGYLAYFWARNLRLTPVQKAFFGFSFLTPLYFAAGGTDECLTVLWAIGCLASFIFIKMPSMVGHWRPNLSNGRFVGIMLSIAAVFAVLAIGRLGMIRSHSGSFANFMELQFAFFVSGCFFAILFALGGIRQSPQWLSNGVRFIADYSYSLYLTHATVFIFLLICFPEQQNNWYFAAFAIIIAQGVAIIMWYLFERHHKKLSEILRGWLNQDRVP